MQRHLAFFRTAIRACILIGLDLETAKAGNIPRNVAMEAISFTRRWSMYRKYGEKLNWKELEQWPYRQVAMFEIADEAMSEKQKSAEGKTGDSEEIIIPEGFFLEEGTLTEP